MKIYIYIFKITIKVIFTESETAALVTPQDAFMKFWILLRFIFSYFIRNLNFCNKMFLPFSQWRIIHIIVQFDSILLLLLYPASKLNILKTKLGSSLSYTVVTVIPIGCALDYVFILHRAIIITIPKTIVIAFPADDRWYKILFYFKTKSIKGLLKYNYNGLHNILIYCVQFLIMFWRPLNHPVHNFVYKC